MPDEPILREKARDAVERDKMPNRQPDRLWGGPGADVPCTICGRPVAKGEMEFEVQFVRDGGAPSFQVYHLHVRCYAAWELERSKVDSARGPSAGPSRGREEPVR